MSVLTLDRQTRCVECRRPIVVQWTSMWGPQGPAHVNCQHFLNTLVAAPELFGWGELDAKGDLLRERVTPLSPGDVEAMLSEVSG